MTILPSLQAGDELHCPHCRHWHPVNVRHATGTDYTTRMLYWTCRGAVYYAGQLGTSSRHETRQSGSAFPSTVPHDD